MNRFNIADSSADIEENLIKDCKKDDSIKAESAVAIGKFDGTHIGHQYLLKELIKAAKENGYRSVVLLIGMNNERIEEKKEKKDYLYSLGVEEVTELELKPEIREMSAEQFLKEILIDELKMKYLIGGTDISFGYQKKGNSEFLKEKAPEYGFQYKLIDKVKDPKSEYSDDISSSLIRGKIKEGKMEDACRLMGKHYEIRGIVQHGRHYGTEKTGFPTINQNVDESRCLPPNGVYVTKVTVERTNQEEEQLKNEFSEKPNVYYGISDLGVKPSLNDGQDPLQLETFLLDAGPGLDLYGKTVNTELLHYVRPEMKFETLEDLKKQIAETDIPNAERYIKEHKEV